MPLERKPHLLPVLLFACCSLATGEATAREAVAETSAFRFFSDFDTNLNDALINTGVDRNFERAELFQSGEEQACFESLAPSLQAGWNLAVDYYAAIISPHDFGDRRQELIRRRLAGLPMRQDERTEQYLSLAANFMASATPAYTACRWSAQDSKNRDWLERLLPQLERHEAAIAERLAERYLIAWPDSRFDVDIVETVSWAGANSYFPSDRAGHLLVASDPNALESLELVFHEATHGFMLGDGPLRIALQQAAEQQGTDTPPGLWHVILFVTTGETVREVLDEAGRTDYRPMIYGIYPRSPWGQYQDGMDAVWPDYLDGTVTADEALRALLARDDVRQPM